MRGRGSRSDRNKHQRGSSFAAAAAAKSSKKRSIRQDRWAEGGARMTRGRDETKRSAMMRGDNDFSSPAEAADLSLQPSRSS
eukprot:7194459-Pyramimonas_sp.AAC.2